MRSESESLRKFGFGAATMHIVPVWVALLLIATAVAKYACCQDPGSELDLVGKAVAEAKSQNRLVAVVPRLLVMPPPPVRSVDDIVGHYTVVVGTPLSSVVQNNRFTLTTWYRFRVEETLLRQPTVPGGKLSPPESFGSLMPGEVWLLVDGGDTIIDGVKVVQYTTALKVGDRYLLVLALRSNGSAGVLAAMEDGVFSVGAKSELTPMRRAALSRDIEARGIANVASLRVFLGRRSR